MNLQSCKFYGILSITVPATPLLCMRTEAGQLLVEMVYSLPQTRVEIGEVKMDENELMSLPHTRVEIGVVTALRKHPAAGIGFIPIPCFYGIMIMSSYAKVSGDHPWDFGSKAREPLVLKAPCLLICGIIMTIHNVKVDVRWRR